MESDLKLVSGAMITLSLATAATIVVPFLQWKDEPTPPALKDSVAGTRLLRKAGRLLPESPG